MISWFARNSVAANLLMVTIIIGGILALRNGVRMEIFPNAEPDTVTVSVPLRGATPEDVELGVAVRIEEAVQDLEGIDRIRSVSREGSTSVNIEIEPAYDPRDLLDDIFAPFLPALLTAPEVDCLDDQDQPGLRRQRRPCRHLFADAGECPTLRRTA